MARLNKFSDKNRKKKKKNSSRQWSISFSCKSRDTTILRFVIHTIENNPSSRINIITVIPCMLHTEVGLDASKKYFLAVIILYIVTLIFNFGI